LSIIAAFVGTLVLMVPAMALARRLGAVAHPRDDRWGNRAVPRLGGVAIAVALGLAATLLPLPATVRAILVIGIGVIALLGLADDLGTVSVATRLAVEILVGAAAVATLWSDLGLIAIPAACVAMVGVPLVINATNLIDNADGVAAGVSALTGLGLAAMAALFGNVGLANAGLVSAAACVGFLVYNFPPARVFMGDVGSLPLGFFLAAVTALVAREAVASDPVRINMLLAIPLVWAVQLGDLGMVLITRLRRGTSPLRGGIDHTSHRLMRAGLSPMITLTVIAACAAACAGLGVIGSVTDNAITTGILVLVVFLLVGAAEGALAARIGHE
jgi:UDP-GlcNAc:undecaprenyl-phosphate GlcNAc-1-phosphate transferase